MSLKRQSGRPLTGSKLKATREFLADLGLGWEEDIDFTVNLLENSHLQATGSRSGRVLKCLGVTPGSRSRGLAAIIMTELIKEAAAEGLRHLFLYTRPENVFLFEGLGFYPLIENQSAALMENRPDGLKNYLAALEPKVKGGRISAIVANCNPFTKGHLYLIEKAAEESDFLHLFLLSEEKSEFLYESRLAMTRAATEHLSNLAIHPSGQYQVSSATFPQYFLKSSQPVEEAHCELDLLIFAEHIAPALNLTTRYVGAEPFCPTTSAYNQRMKALLPAFGLEIRELERQKESGQEISASLVRAFLSEGRLAEACRLTPAGVIPFLERSLRDGRFAPR